MARDWNLKTTPIRALKREKLVAMVAGVKGGREVSKEVGAELEEGDDGVASPVARSAGITCWMSLWRRERWSDWLVLKKALSRGFGLLLEQLVLHARLGFQRRQPAPSAPALVLSMLLIT